MASLKLARIAAPTVAIVLGLADLTWMVLGIGLAAQTIEVQPDSLFAQSAQLDLSRVRLASGPGRVSWLLLDTRAGQAVAAEWPDANQAIPLGSLTKPFVALAYARTHREFPVWKDTSGSTQPQCRRPRLNIEEAIGYSCNEYFLALARETSPDAMDAVAKQYGLPLLPGGEAAPDSREGLASAMIGMSGTWRIAPAQLMQAYVQMLRGPDAAVESAGMRIAANAGTARALRSFGVLAKTGTAPCIAHCTANNDGFVVVLTPAVNPRLLLMVEEKGTTGAGAAVVAAKMLAQLEALHGRQ